MGAGPIYVEIAIGAPLEAVWNATQDPAVHQTWDLRFTRIEYLPRDGADAPQLFRYATRIGFGLELEGRGESRGASAQDGERTSALRFWSEDPRSLIREGAGYWKYVPDGSGTVFLTRYDYATRFGAAGALFDRLVFRPLLGWATAWSFDRLRLVLEQGTPARFLFSASAARAVSRIALALSWIWQGVVPKLLFRDTGELELLRRAGLFPGREASVLWLLGVGEVLLGLALLVRFRSSLLPRLVIALLLALLAGAALADRAVFIAPFSPVPLTLALVGLAAADLMLARVGLPSAARCKRRP